MQFPRENRPAFESDADPVSLNSGVNVLYERKGSTINDYVFADGLLIARISGSSQYYYHQDHLGNTRLVTLGSNTNFSSNYEPYGAQYAVTGTDPEFKYTGKPQTLTGLYYYGARWYNQSLGRFLTRDPNPGRPSNPQSLNLYVYVLNNPLRYTDPTGESWWNPFTWSQQQQAQAFTIAVIAVSIVVVVATFGAGTPLAAAAIGAAIGASTSTATYTIVAGSKATLTGAALSALTGAITGAIGGGVGAAAAKAGLPLVAGALLSGGAAAGGNQLGKIINSAVTHQSYNLDPRDLVKDFFIGALTYGVGNEIGVNGNAQQMAENRVFGSISDYVAANGEEMDFFNTFPAANPSPFVSSLVPNTRLLIQVGQLAYNAGTQIGGSLVDFFT